MGLGDIMHLILALETEDARVMELWFFFQSFREATEAIKYVALLLRIIRKRELLGNSAM